MAKRNSDLAPIGFLEKAATNLDQQWQFVVNDHSENTDLKYIEASGLAEKISNAINHAQVAYRFLLPIQLLGKVTDANLDCRAMQAGADRPGVKAQDGVHCEGGAGGASSPAARRPAMRDQGTLTSQRPAGQPRRS